MAFIPGIPNLVYMFIVALLFAINDNFLHLTVTNILILGIISLVAMIIDFLSGAIGAKWGGAHWVSIFTGFVGLVLGSIFIPIPILGSLIGMFLGVLIPEWYRTGDLKIANRAAVGSFIGTIAGTVIRVVVSFIFLILSIIFVLN